MKRLPITPILALALVIAAAVWWFMNFERVSKPVYVGLSGKAQQDPYLALRLLLKQSGLRLEEPAVGARPAQKFDTLPANGTLLLGDRRHVLMTPGRVKAITAWVEAGGHVIVEAEYPGRPDPLLGAFGLARKAVTHGGARANPPAGTSDGKSDGKFDGKSDGKSDGKPDGKPAGKTGVDAETEQDAAAKSDREANNAPRTQPVPAVPKRKPARNAEITEVAFAGDTRVMNVEFNAYQHLDQPAISGYWVVTDRAGVRMVSGARGNGRVTAMSNFDFLTYRGSFDIKELSAQPTHIGKYDHAEMFVKLLRLNPQYQSAALRLVWGDDDVSLWDWLVEHALLALTSLAVLILLWLWRVVPRFGPLAPEAPPAEQKLLSHLEASGRFYWKHMEPPEIYAKLRAAFVQRLKERRPGIAQRNPDQRNAELARLIAARPEAVARALDAPARSVGELVRNAIVLQRLSQKL